MDSKDESIILTHRKATVMTTLTPYKASQLANAALKEAGLSKEIRPQMMYNYRKNRLIKTNSDGEFLLESFEGWLARYISKQLALVTAE